MDIYTIIESQDEGGVPSVPDLTLYADRASALEYLAKTHLITIVPEDDEVIWYSGSGGTWIEYNDDTFESIEWSEAERLIVLEKKTI